jgi:hypothetical protein
MSTTLTLTDGEMAMLDTALRTTAEQCDTDGARASDEGHKHLASTFSESAIAYRKLAEKLIDAEEAPEVAATPDEQRYAIRKSWGSTGAEGIPTREQGWHMVDWAKRKRWEGTLEQARAIIRDEYPSSRGCDVDLVLVLS